MITVYVIWRKNPAQSRCISVQHNFKLLSACFDIQASLCKWLKKSHSEWTAQPFPFKRSCIYFNRILFHRNVWKIGRLLAVWLDLYFWWVYAKNVLMKTISQRAHFAKCLQNGRCWVAKEWPSPLVPRIGRISWVPIGCPGIFTTWKQ